MKKKQNQHLEVLSPHDPIPRSIPAPRLLTLTAGLRDLCLERVKCIHQHTCVHVGMCINMRSRPGWRYSLRDLQELMTG